MKRTFLALLLSITLRLTAALVPGSEKEVTSPILLDEAAYDQSDARIATDGTTFLTVWIDHAVTGPGDLLGIRVTWSGTREGFEPLRIAATAEDESRAALEWGAGRYLVAWSTPTALRARFVGNDSSLSAVIDIAALPNGVTQPQVAFNGHVFLVTWSNGFGATFRGAIVDPNGGAVVKTFDVASTDKTLADTALVAAGGAFQFISAVTDFGGAPTGNGYPADVGVTRIDGSGTVGPRVVVAPSSTPVFLLSAAARNDEIAIGWTTALAIPGASIRTVRVTPAGPAAIESIPADGLVLNDVAADSAGFFVIYGDHQHRNLRRLDGSPSRTLAVHAPESEVLDAASNDERSVLVERSLARPGFEYGPAGGDLYLMRLDTQEAMPIVAPRHQMFPDLAASNDLRLAVWCEYLGTEYFGNEPRLGLMYTRIDANGTTLEPYGIALGPSLSQPTAARVASNGEEWLLTWVEGSTVYGSRVSSVAGRLDDTPIVIAQDVLDGSAVAVSWDGTQYVVIYQRGQFLRGLHASIRAARVSSQGTVAPEVTLSPDAAANELLALASGPQGSLAVWRSGPYLQGALLSLAGTATPVSFPAVSPVGPRSSVAWNGDTFLVAAPVTGSFGTQVQWTLVSATGNVTTPQTAFVDIDSTVTAGTYGVPSVEVEPFGDTFLLYWNGVGHSREQRFATVYAARISRDGVLADTPVPIGTTLADLWPTLGASGATVVYARPIGHPVREVTRVFAKTMQVVAGNPRRRAVH